MRAFIFSVFVLLLAPALAWAQSAGFTVGGAAISQDDIIDARALPGMDGAAALMITMTDAATARLQSLPADITISWQGKAIAQGPATSLIASNVLMINSGTGSVEETTALAKAISGKDPLPDSLDETE